MQRREFLIATGLSVPLATLRSPLAQAQAPAPAAPIREITPIAGNVHRFRNNNHYSIFVVTPAGVVATDPINADAARWLRAEIERRFGQPIRYVIYSHDHADHIAGGEVWADSAVVVAHENAKRTIRDERRPTALPQLTFTDGLALEVGGTLLELSYVGRNHSDNSIVVRLPAERLLFAVDFIPVEAVAFRDLPDAYIPDWIDSLARVERMDFDVLVPGHGPLGRREHVGMFRQYLTDLRNEVLRVAREGRSLEEAKQLITLPRYERWAGYQQMLPLNIEGMYRRVQLHRRPNP
jgi:glyoxylase-like metal-dependent hydrolase (beta-lactamase superfamily II)